MSDEIFRLPFENAFQIKEWADKYSYKDKSKENIVIEIASTAKKRGYMMKDEFLEICKWKTQRQNKNYKQNEEKTINLLTKISFGKECDDNDEVRIEILTLLKGVNMRVASTILHLAFLGGDNGYPMMDVRALNALGYNTKNYEDLELWFGYTKFCRKQAQKYHVNMRTLDKALAV